MNSPTTAFLALWLASCCVPVPTGDKASPGGSPAAEKAPVAAQAVDLKTLLKDYKDNEVRADGLYKGKVVETSGKIADIGVSLGRPHLTINQTGEKLDHPALQCNFGKDQSDKIAQLAKGAPVKVAGKVSGFFVLNVVAGDCELR